MSEFDFRGAEILDCLVYQKSGLEVTILTADHWHPWDDIDFNEGQTPKTNPEVHDNTAPWNTKILGYVRRPSVKQGQGPIVAHCEAFLVKRDLIIYTADEYGKFYNLVDRNSQTLGRLGHKLFNSEGRVRGEFKGKGIWGAESDDSWILMITKILVNHKIQRQGVGRALIGAVLGQVLLWASQQTPPRAVLTIAEPSVLREEKESFQRSQRRYPGDMSIFVGSSLERAKKFWRSWGFVQLENTDYFAWRRSIVPDPALQLPPSSRPKEAKVIAADLRTLYEGEAEKRHNFYGREYMMKYGHVSRRDTFRV